MILGERPLQDLSDEGQGKESRAGNVEYSWRAWISFQRCSSSYWKTVCEFFWAPQRNTGSFFQIILGERPLQGSSRAGGAGLGFHGAAEPSDPKDSMAGIP